MNLGSSSLSRNFKLTPGHKLYDRPPKDHSPVPILTTLHSEQNISLISYVIAMISPGLDGTFYKDIESHNHII